MNSQYCKKGKLQIQHFEHTIAFYAAQLGMCSFAQLPEVEKPTAADCSHPRKSLSQRVICKSKTRDANGEEWLWLESEAREWRSFPPIPPRSLLNRQWLGKLYKISLRRSLTPSDVADGQSGCITPAAREGGWRCVPESLSNKAEERHSVTQQQTLHSPGAEGCSRWCSL